ncbi:hypothetical protein [Ruminococcus albus]|nr:hypothetical protein [Ruminococcus albus]
MMEAITVGEKIRLTNSFTGDHPIDSTATILYINNFDVVSIEWSDGKLSNYSDHQILSNFEEAGA